MPEAPLAERVDRYVAQPDPEGFDELARSLAAHLCGLDEGFRQACERAGIVAADLGDWREIPLAPLGEPNGADDVAGDAAERAFQAGCLEDLQAPPLLGLVPRAETTAASGLARSAERLAERFGGPGSSAAITESRVDIGAARSWLAGRQRDRRAAVLLASRAALERLLGALDRQDLRFRLPPGSRIVLMDALGPEAPPIGDMLRRASERLALPTGALLGRHAWPSVPTPLYGRLAADGGLEGAIPSPWIRIRSLDPETGLELGAGAPGRLAVLDLTIRERPFHLMTPTTGSITDRSVRILPAGPVVRAG